MLYGVTWHSQCLPSPKLECNLELLLKVEDFSGGALSITNNFYVCSTFQS